MRTYDYILAMKEQNQFSELDDSDFSSDDSSDFDSPERSTLVSRFICRGHRDKVYILIELILEFVPSQAINSL